MIANDDNLCRWQLSLVSCPPVPYYVGPRYDRIILGLHP